MNTPDKPIWQLKQEALTGNMKSFEQLLTASLDYAPDEFVCTELIVANKYHYYPAYSMIFHNMLRTQGIQEVKNIGEIDERTRKFMIECLENAKGKDEEADSLLAEISRIDHGRYYSVK